MKSIVYDVHLIEPLVAGATGGDPNEMRTLDYIPGSMLRGGWIALYRKAGHVINPSDSSSRRLFFDGGTRYLNGYLRSNDSRTIPSRLAWLWSKHALADYESGKREDKAIYDAINDSLIPDDVSVPLGNYYCSIINKDGLSIHQTQKLRRVHNTRDRIFGRPIENSGNVYRYEFIRPGQVFRTAILFDTDSDVDMILKLFEDNKVRMRLGRSKSAGYGSCRVQLVNVVDACDDVRMSGFVRENSRRLARITFVSDALVRNQFGLYAADGNTVAYAVSHALGKPKETVTCANCCAGTTVVGGFDRTWGLPTTQMYAIRMGSVYELEGVSESELESIEHRGLGERKIDGFGRFITGDLLETPCGFKVEQNHTIYARARLSGESARMAQFIVERIANQRRRFALRYKNADLNRFSKTSSSQLAQLRCRIQDAIRQLSTGAGAVEDEENKLKVYLQSLRDRRSTREQFADDLIWLEQCVTMQLDLCNEMPTLKIGGQTPLEKNKFIHNLRRLDEITKRAMKNKSGSSK